MTYQKHSDLVDKLEMTLNECFGHKKVINKISENSTGPKCLKIDLFDFTADFLSFSLDFLGTVDLEPLMPAGSH